MRVKQKAIDEAIANHPSLPSWKAALLEEMPPNCAPDKFVTKELNSIYSMFLKVAKDRTPAGEDPGKNKITGGGDLVLTKEEFVRNFEAKVKVTDADGKPQKCAVRNAELLFAMSDKEGAPRSGQGDGLLSVQEFFGLMLLIKSKDPNKKLELAFAMCDTNRSGSLDKSEVQNMLMSLVTVDNEDERERIRDQLTAEYVYEVKDEVDAYGRVVLDAAGNCIPVYHAVYLYDAIGNPVLDANGSHKKKPGLLDSLIAKADAKSGNGDGLLTLEELKAGLGDCGWMAEYVGHNITRVDVANSAFSGRSTSTMCLVM